MNLPWTNRDPETPRSRDADADRRRRRIVVAWLAVFCWAGVIWRLGGDDFSAEQTSSMLIEWLRALSADLDPRTRYRLIIGFRKSAHFIEYSILALLTFRAAMISAGRNQFASAAWIALFLVMALASADEARQAFSSVRTGSPYDVLIDLTGGAVTIAALLLISRRMRVGAEGEKKAELA